MKLTVLLSMALVILCYTGQSGGSSRMLTATASTNNQGKKKLQVWLQSGNLSCNPMKFTCNNIYEQLEISQTCSGENCTKLFILCESPQETCINYDDIRSIDKVHPSPTSVQERVTVTVYETKTIGTQSHQNDSISSGLGVLLSLVIVALVVVITGWVWTCWVMKTRGGMIVNTEQQVSSFQNPMYTEHSQTHPPSSETKISKSHETNAATYDTISLSNIRKTVTAGNHDTTAGLKKANETVTPQNNDYRLGLQDVENNYQLMGKEESSLYSTNKRREEIDDDYADPDEEDGWGQEENVYHVLEAPNQTGKGPSVEGEEPSIEGEELTGDATVYEVPIKSK